MVKELTSNPLKVFVDTSFFQALLNPNDQYHAKALELVPLLAEAKEVWTTYYVLIEVADMLAVGKKQQAVEILDNFRANSEKVQVVGFESDWMQRALVLMRTYDNKKWGMTEAISFLVMNDNGITDALTTDPQFDDMGFRALMLK
jgi:uncharacterized protein